MCGTEWPTKRTGMPIWLQTVNGGPVFYDTWLSEGTVCHGNQVRAVTCYALTLCGYPYPRHKHMELKTVAPSEDSVYCNDIRGELRRA